MSGRIRYHPLFDCDVREAAGWYDRRSEGLGDAFVELVRATVDNVISDPNRFAGFTPGVQYARIPRFPYVVLFGVHADELFLLGVMHTAQSMDKWRERVSDE